jgi:hypothetical protein
MQFMIILTMGHATEEVIIVGIELKLVRESVCDERVNENGRADSPLRHTKTINRVGLFSAGRRMGLVLG